MAEGLKGQVFEEMAVGQRVWVFVFDHTTHRPFAVVSGKVDEYTVYKPYAGETNTPFGQVLVTVEDPVRADVEALDEAKLKLAGKQIVAGHPIRRFVAVPKSPSMDFVVLQLRAERTRYTDTFKEQTGIAKLLAEAFEHKGIGQDEIKQAIKDGAASSVRLSDAERISAVEAGVKQGFMGLWSGWRTTLQESVSYGVKQAFTHQFSGWREAADLKDIIADAVRKGLTVDMADKVMEAIKATAADLLRGKNG